MGNFFKSIAVLLSVPLLLSGCNSSATSAENQQSSIQEEENLSDNANENTSTEASKEQITLTFSYWGDKNELACKEELGSASQHQDRSNLYGRSKLSYEASDILYLRSGP